MLSLEILKKKEKERWQTARRKDAGSDSFEICSEVHLHYTAVPTALKWAIEDNSLGDDCVDHAWRDTRTKPLTTGHARTAEPN